MTSATPLSTASLASTFASGLAVAGATAGGRWWRPSSSSQLAD